MLRYIILMIAVISILFGATRVYDIEPYKNCNDWSPQGPPTTAYVGQTFVATCDSFLWAEVFIGAANNVGHYNFRIEEYQTSTLIATGDTNAGPGIYYNYVRAYLEHLPNAKVMKGKTYILKVTHSNGDSINFYYNPNGYVYPYGEIKVGGGSFQPPQPNTPDLAARIEGITRIPQDLFGTEIEMSFFPEKLYSWDYCVAKAESMGVTWDREGLHLMWLLFGCQPDSLHLDYFNWSLLDSLMLKAARDSIKVIPYIANYTAPFWAIHASTKDGQILVKNCQTGFPCVLNLFDSVTIGVTDTINPLNFLAHYVYHFVERYKPSGKFWKENPDLDSSLGWKYLEVGGEPNFKVLMSYRDTANVEYYDSHHIYYDTVYRRMEDDFLLRCGGDMWEARRRLRDTVFYQTLVVAESAAKIASPEIKILAPQIASPNYTRCEVPESLWWERGKEFLQKQYQRGLKNLSDIITASCYQNDYGYFDWNQFKMTVDTIRAIMNEYDDAEKELWATEYGFNVIPGWNTESTKANAVPQAYLTTIDGTEEPFRRLNRICWFCFTRRLFREELIADTGFVLTDTNYNGYPAYFAYKQMTERLKGKIFNKKDTSVSPPFYAYELEDTAGKKCWVAWKQTGGGSNPTSIEFPARTDNAQVESIQYVTNPSWHGISAGTDGYVTLSIDTKPVYLFENQNDSLYRPDLVIDSLKVLPDTPYAYARCTLYCYLKNAGKKATLDTFSVVFYQDDKTLDVHLSTSSLPSDSTRLIKYPVMPIIPGGRLIGQMPVLFKAVANSEKSFVELSYDNNTRFRFAIIQGDSSVPIDWVTNPYATAFNQGRHLVRIGNDSLNIVYANNGKIIHSYSMNKGVTWSKEELENGFFPSIGIDQKKYQWITFWQEGNIICIVRNDQGYSKRMVVFDSDDSTWAGPPAIAMGTVPSGQRPFAYITYPVYVSDAVPNMPLEPPPNCHYSCIKLSILDTVNIAHYIIDSVHVNNPVSYPAVAVTPADYIHLVWQKGGEIWYRTDSIKITYQNWQNITFKTKVNISGSPTVPSKHPFVESYGDKVYAAWREGADTLPGEIFRRRKTISSPLWDATIVNISQSPTKESDYPVLATSDVVAYQEKIDNSNFEIYTWINGDIVNLSETDNPSKFPHILVEPPKPHEPEVLIDAIWTETVIPDTLYEVKFKQYRYLTGPKGMSEYISVTIGDSVASPYCEQRDGYIDYAEFSCDYDNSSLIYNIPYLNPASNYLLRAVVYKEGSQIGQEEVYVDTTFVTQVIYTPYVPETVYVLLPKATYENDFEIGKEIEKILGNYALLADLKIYEVSLADDSAGNEGAQGNTVNIKRFALYQNHPNPFKDLTKIAFALPKECKVSLSVYNVTGRKVRTLINDKMKPGDYSLKWDGKDNQNRKLSNGIYFYRLQTEDFKDTKKTVLLK
jgi:hypothetical protein